MINNVGQIVNIREISESLGIGSEKTTRKYLDYLCQAFLIIPVQKFSYKSRQRLTNEKAYIIDTGIMTYRHNALATKNLGWRLENVIMMELMRRSNPDFQDIHYYRPQSQSREIDFVITNHGVVTELIQVSLDISNPKTLKRELSALAEASEKLHCDNLTLISLSRTRDEHLNGKTIHIISADEWLVS